jgi:molybdopterin guanine dinucleotide-containing S/N-oxide reductase-like protein
MKLKRKLKKMSEKKSESIADKKISRRSMLKWTGAIAAAVVVGAGAGYGTDQLLRPITTFTTTTTTHEPIQTIIYQEQRYPCSIGNSGGGAALWADVKDGRLIRLSHIELQDDEYKPWVITVKGKQFMPPRKWHVGGYMMSSRRYLAYSPRRVKYPLKRVGFVPGGNGPVANRGRSEFVRISWTEALDIIHDEFTRINAKYGQGALLVMTDGHSQAGNVHKAHGYPFKVAQVMQGGATTVMRNPDSWEGWVWGATHAWGFTWGSGLADSNDMYEEVMNNCELLIHWAHDPETTAWRGGQIQTYYTRWFKELGIEQIWICPDCNAAVGKWADSWVPVIPNRDDCLALAIANVWINEGLYDKNYVYTHGVGFDKWKDYIMGVEDGTPKTPEWAEPLCGVKASVIKALARHWASKKTTIITMSGGPGERAAYGHEWPRMVGALLVMQGFGRPGVHFFTVRQGWPKDQQVSLTGSVTPGNSGLPGTSTYWKTVGVQVIEKTAVPLAILNATPEKPLSFVLLSSTWPTSYQFVHTDFPQPGYSGIHAFWMTNPCWITNWNAGNQMVEALKSPKVEFILVQHPWLEGDCAFADIILPGKSLFERTDLMSSDVGHLPFIIYTPQAISPIGESLSDWETCVKIADRMGVRTKFTDGKSVDDLIAQTWSNCNVAAENKKPATMKITLEDFKKKGYLAVPFPPMDQYVDTGDEKTSRRKIGGPGIRWWYNKPNGGGLGTNSGNFEFEASDLKQGYPDDEERPPVPHYIPYGVTNQDSLTHPRAKQYPLINGSNHPRWRHHARYDGSSWVTEIPEAKIYNNGYYYEPMWINPIDAKARGISNGDVIKAFNERGAVIMGAYVTERIKPGVVMSSEGANYDPVSVDSGNLLDKGGATNSIGPGVGIGILSRNAWGMNCSAWLLEVQKWQGPVPKSIRETNNPNAGWDTVG